MLATKTKAGERDRRITILQKTVTTNSFNEEVVSSWSTFATVWAKLTEYQGTEKYEADQLTEDRLTVFDIWHLSGVTVEMRIEFDDRLYDIKSILTPDRRSMKLKALLLDET